LQETVELRGGSESWEGDPNAVHRNQEINHRKEKEEPRKGGTRRNNGLRGESV